MKKILKGSFISVLAFFAMFSPRSVFAACNSGSGSGLTNPICFDSLGEFLLALLDIAVALATPVIILFIVYIGFRFVQESAAGNADKMKDLRSSFVWALVGALIVLGARALSAAIQATVTDLSSGI